MRIGCSPFLVGPFMCAVFATLQHAWYAHDFACVDDLAISDTVDHLDEMPYFYWLIVLRAVREERPIFH